jgi:hypothetical protein
LFYLLPGHEFLTGKKVKKKLISTETHLKLQMTQSYIGGINSSANDDNLRKWYLLA